MPRSALVRPLKGASRPARVLARRPAASSPLWGRLLREEDGQALLYGAGVIVIIMACFFTAVDLGQATLYKIQAQNAADAAALSAASLKAGVHNTRQLAYRAASGQTNLARAQMVKATALALKALGGAGTNDRAFKDALGLALAHRQRVEQLRDGIQQFNQWAISPEAGNEAVRAAAEIGYLGNIGTLGMANQNNLVLFRNMDAMAESSNKFDGSKTVGGVIYPAEGLTATGASGKTLVRIKPRTGSPLGNAFAAAGLNYGDAAKGGEFIADASAGPYEAERNFGSAPFLKTYGLNHWYTARLLYIGRAPGEK